jgi:poly(beta-D-mannuronate) lyase
MFCCVTGTAFAREPRKVSSIEQLRAAVEKAEAGDRIVVANGSYVADAPISITAVGSDAKPIVIAAESVGGVTITGAGGFRLEAPATYVTVKGFVFKHASSQAIIGAGTSHCRFTRNVFETNGNGEYLTVAGNDEEIDHNTFQNKNSMGRLLAIRGVGSQIAQRIWIHHNYLRDFLPQKGNGAEGLQFGLSGFSLSSSYSIVEYNLFERVNGELEMVSDKASDVTYRYNTFRDNKQGQFTLRHGNNCKIYGNYFIDSLGLRFFGDDHQIFSNFFIGNSPAIQIGNGDGVVPPDKLTSHDRPDRDFVVHNTLVNNKENVVLSQRRNGLGATYIVFANNIIQGGDTAVSINGPLPNAKWEGNILWNVSAPGDIPAPGFRKVDPRLEKDADGEFHLQAGSPAIGRALGSYPFVTVDQDAQPRPAAKLAVGADEVSTATTKARILMPADVGPNAD